MLFCCSVVPMFCCSVARLLSCSVVLFMVLLVVWTSRAALPPSLSSHLSSHPTLYYSPSHLTHPPPQPPHPAHPPHLPQPAHPSHSHRRFGTNDAYHGYLNETSILIPLPNFIYRNLPNLIKGDRSPFLDYFFGCHYVPLCSALSSFNLSWTLDQTYPES